MYEEKVTNWHMLRLQNQSFTLSEKTLHFDILYCNQGDKNSSGITLSIAWDIWWILGSYTSFFERNLFEFEALRVRISVESEDILVPLSKVFESSDFYI